MGELSERGSLLASFELLCSQFIRLNSTYYYT